MVWSPLNTIRKIQKTDFQSNCHTRSTYQCDLLNSESNTKFFLHIKSFIEHQKTCNHFFYIYRTIQLNTFYAHLTGAYAYFIYDDAKCLN